MRNCLKSTRLITSDKSLKLKINFLERGRGGGGKGEVWKADRMTSHKYNVRILICHVMFQIFRRTVANENQEALSEWMKTASPDGLQLH